MRLSLKIATIVVKVISEVSLIDFEKNLDWREMGRLISLTMESGLEST